MQDPTFTEANKHSRVRNSTSSGILPTCIDKEKTNLLWVGKNICCSIDLCRYEEANLSSGITIARPLNSSLYVVVATQQLWGLRLASESSNQESSLHFSSCFLSLHVGCLSFSGRETRHFLFLSNSLTLTPYFIILSQKAPEIKGGLSFKPNTNGGCT